MIYNAEVRQKQLATNDVLDFTSGALLRENWSAFAQTLCAEAGELSISCRSLSLTSFIKFLANRCVHHVPGAAPGLSQIVNPFPGALPAIGATLGSGSFDLFSSSPSSSPSDLVGQH